MRAVGRALAERQEGHGGLRVAPEEDIVARSAWLRVLWLEPKERA